MIPTVLVIEDNSLNLEFVARQLRADPRTRHTPILISTSLDLSATEREELLRHVQTIVPKSGPGGILEALERLGLSPEGSG